MKVAHVQTPAYLCYSYKKRQRVSRFSKESTEPKFWGQCQKW